MSFDFAALQRTVAFIATPYLLAVMDSIEEGRQPGQALSGALPEQIDLAVQRLLEVGAARLVVADQDLSAVDARVSLYPLELTRKGRRVLELLRDLREPATSAPVLADDEDPILAAGQVTKR